MLDCLAQPDPAGVRAYPYPGPRSEQQVGDVLVHSGNPGRVDLHDVKRSGLQQLLEYHPVGNVLAGCDRDRGDRAADLRHGQDVIRERGLFHPCEIELGELPDPPDRLAGAPDLIRVYRDQVIRTADLPGQRKAPHIVLDAAAHLELDLAESFADGLAEQSGQVIVGIAEPARRSRVGRIAAGCQLQDPRGLALCAALQHIQCLGRSDRVLQVPEVDQRH